MIKVPTTRKGIRMASIAGDKDSTSESMPLRRPLAEGELLREGFGGLAAGAEGEAARLRRNMRRKRAARPLAAPCARGRGGLRAALQRHSVAFGGTRRHSRAAIGGTRGPQST